MGKIVKAVFSSRLISSKIIECLELEGDTQGSRSPTPIGVKQLRYAGTGILGMLSSVEDVASNVLY